MRAANSFPAHNIDAIALTAFLAIGAVRQQIKIAVLAGTAVNVRMVPRIEWNVFLQIWSIPIFHIRWTNTESLETFLCRRVTANIQPEKIEHAFKLRNLRLRRRLASSFYVPKEALSDQSCEQRNDDHDDQELN